MPRRCRLTALLTFRALVLVWLLALAGCSDPDPATQDGEVAVDAPLPGPLQSGGAGTVMPASPGPGEVPLGGAAPSLRAGDTMAGAPEMEPLVENPEAGLIPLVAVDPSVTPGTTSPAAPVAGAATTPIPDPAPAAEVEDPRDLLRRYYAAINARDFAAAHAAWADASAAPGQTPDQFAAAFSEAASIELTLGAPRAPEGAAGSVYVEVPVTVTTTRTDGSVQHQAGRYTLRRSQVDGASAAQRGWRITAMDLRDAAR